MSAESAAPAGESLAPNEVVVEEEERKREEARGPSAWCGEGLEGAAGGAAVVATREVPEAEAVEAA
jgi:hypothetical protein